jgi:hypothetical protein
MDDELVRTGKERFWFKIEVISQHLPCGAEEKYENQQSG